MPLPRAGHPTARAVKASAPLKTAARRPCVVVVVVVVRTPTPNYLRQASQNLGKYNLIIKSASYLQNRLPTCRGSSIYRWLRHRLKNYNEQNFIIIAILIMIAAHLSFLLLLSFLFLFLL